MGYQVPDVNNCYDFTCIISQLEKFCCENAPLVQSVYDECKATSLSEQVSYLLCVVKKTLESQVCLMKSYKELYEFVKKWYEKLYNTVYGDDFINKIILPKVELWVKNNIENFIGDAIKQVFFGLTDNGYFIAYIPDSWNEIIFGTCMTDKCYGRLTLTY